MILTFFTVAIALYAIIGVFIFFGMLRLPASTPKTSPQPRVSILITCRNEEEDLPDCLASLEQIDYPADLLQVILVDDHSTDNTASLLKEAADKNTYFEFYSGNDFEETHLNAKARGIARAASKATGEWLFITDADAVIPPTWVKHMLSGLEENAGMIVAPTFTRHHNFVTLLEKIAGMYTIPIGWGFAGWGIALNGLGPNMAIRRNVYEQAGGLENADFTIAEDMAMFRMAKNNGYDIKYHMDEQTLIELKPVKTFKQVISQQRRWLRGGFEGSKGESLILFFLFLFAFLFSVSYFIILILYPVQGLIFSSMKLATDLLGYFGLSNKINRKGLLHITPIAFFYSLIAFIWLPISLLFDKKTSWIGDGYMVKYE